MLLSSKVAHRGFSRIIPLGPKAQEIVKRYLKPNMEAYLFWPRASGGWPGLSSFLHGLLATLKKPVARRVL
jgi:hypothetical protein